MSYNGSNEENSTCGDSVKDYEGYQKSESRSVVSRLSVAPWSGGCQVPLSMGFSRQEY